MYAWGYSLGLMDVDGSVPLTPLSQEVALAIAFFKLLYVSGGEKGGVRVVLWSEHHRKLCWG